MAEFLHERRDFDQLLAVVANDRGLDTMLVEKDYWIMHGLWGLQAQGFVFELKGGTSLSKGFGVIHRFSEDIDIRIEPPADMDVKTGRNQDKPAHIASRQAYYDALARRIRIPGIDNVKRDTFFDDDKMRSAGIRLSYTSRVATLANFLRHYYDVYCLLELQEVQDFMQTTAYHERKKQRFRSGDELVIDRNPAFTLSDSGQRQLFAREYRKSSALYYQGQPEFELLLERITNKSKSSLRSVNEPFDARARSSG